MFDKYTFHKVAGLAIHINTDGSFTINGCILDAQQKGIQIERKFENVKDISELSKNLMPKIPIALNLTGKGILTKKLEKANALDATEFGKVLPNGNINDFVIQHFNSGDHSFISLIRKTEVNLIFEKLLTVGFYPVILCLGPFVIHNVISETNLYNEQIIIDGHHIERNDKGEWIGYKYMKSELSSSKIKIQSETIPEAILLPYASAFQLILYSFLNVIKADAELFDKLFLTKQNNKKLKSGGLSILLVLFLLLLINFVAFSCLDAANNNLTAKVSRTMQDTRGIDEMVNHAKDKEQTLHDLGWDGGLRKGLLIDQLAALLPTDLKWNSVSINPIDNINQDHKILSFSKNKIVISGIADKILAVNEWLARIKTLKWVKKAELENYAYNQELNSGIFTINILYQ